MSAPLHSSAPDDETGAGLKDGPGDGPWDGTAGGESVPEKINALAIDTTSEYLSLAVMKDGVPAAGRYEPLGRGITQEILPRIDGLLRQSGLAARALHLLAVARGPGSFTGTRIGLSVALTFGQVLGKPLLGVDTLRLLAAQTDPSLRRSFRVLLNCARDEVYHAAFRWEEGRLRREGEIALSAIGELLPSLGREEVVLRRYLPRGGSMRGTTPEIEAAFGRLEPLPLLHPRPDGWRLLSQALADYSGQPGKAWPPVTPLYLKSEAFRLWKPATGPGS